MLLWKALNASFSKPGLFSFLAAAHLTTFVLYTLLLIFFSLFPDRLEIRLCCRLLKHPLRVALEDPIALNPHQLLSKQGINASPSHLRSKGMPEAVWVDVFHSGD